MNTVTVETNVYSQNDAAKFAKACQSEVLRDIKLSTKEYDTENLSVVATFTDKETGKPSEVAIYEDEQGVLTGVINSQRLWSHYGDTMHFKGDDENTLHLNKVLADAQAIWFQAADLRTAVINDATAQLAESLTEHVTRFSSPEGRQLVPEEM